MRSLRTALVLLVLLLGALTASAGAAPVRDAALDVNSCGDRRVRWCGARYRALDASLRPNAAGLTRAAAGSCACRRCRVTCTATATRHRTSCSKTHPTGAWTATTQFDTTALDGRGPAVRPRRPQERHRPSASSSSSTRARATPASSTSSRRTRSAASPTTTSRRRCRRASPKTGEGPRRSPTARRSAASTRDGTDVEADRPPGQDRHRRPGRRLRRRQRRRRPERPVRLLRAQRPERRVRRRRAREVPLVADRARGGRGLPRRQRRARDRHRRRRGRRHRAEPDRPARPGRRLAGRDQDRPHDRRTQGQQAGLLLYKENTNWVKVVLVRTGATTAQIEFVRVLNNAYQLDAPFNVAVPTTHDELLPAG